MGIAPLTLDMTSPSNSLITRVGAGSSGLPSTEVFRKNFGEAIPKIVDIRHNSLLMALFSQMGLMGRLQRKLVNLSRKKGRIVPAKGIIASALNACEETDHENLVFVGTEFLEEYHPEEETIAGVLGHEWGHLVSEFPRGLNPDSMSWDEIFAVRREEEANADSYAGRMLYLMNYAPEGLIRLLSLDKHRKQTLKYHDIATRTAIIRRSFSETKRRHEQASRFAVAPHLTYRNPFSARLIAVA